MTVRPLPSSLAAVALAAALALGAAPAVAQTAPAPTPADVRADRQADARAAAQTGARVSKEGRRFVHKAAAGNLAEVALGRLAQEQASHDAVKAFGTTMVQDHSQAYDKLKAIAADKGVEVPVAPEEPAQNQAARLAKLRGAAFDSAYMKHMVDAHRKDIALFEKASKSVRDADLKAYAEQTLPTLKQHLEQAQTTQDALKKGGRKIASN